MFDPSVRRRKWEPTPVFLPGKSHGQRNQVGYNPWGYKESDMTEQLSMHATAPTCKTHTETITFHLLTFFFHGKVEIYIGHIFQESH